MLFRHISDIVELKILIVKFFQLLEEMDLLVSLDALEDCQNVLKENCNNFLIFYQSVLCQRNLNS